MPNWCECAVIVGGEGAEEFLAAVEAEETLFAALLPRPTAFDGVFTGSAKMADGSTARMWRELKSVEPSTDEYLPEGGDVDLLVRKHRQPKLVAVPAAEQAEWLAKYGAKDWYDWSAANWGTKWDPTYERDGHTLRFETAWSPPVRFFETVSQRFPNATFALAYAEGGMGYWGTTIIRNGETRDDYHGYPEEQFWAEVEDGDEDDNPGVTPEVREHLAKYGLGTGG